MYRDRAHPQFGGGTHDADRDLAAVCDQQAADCSALDEGVHGRMMIALTATTDQGK
jgi:hypothetical protein